MTRRNVTLAMAIVVALVALLPAWGQTNGGAVTTTLSKLMFGVDPRDATMTWTTTLRLINRTPNAMHNEIVAVFDARGNRSVAMFTSLYGGSNPTSEGWFWVSPVGECRLVVTGLTPTTVAAPSKVTVEALQDADGLPYIVASATVQETDANGLIVQSYEVVDPSTVQRTPGQAFGFGTDLGVPGLDANLILFNPNIGITANVTVSVYDGYNTATSGHTPITSVTIPVIPGSPVSQMLGQLLANNSDLANLFANPPAMGNGQPDPLLQQVITVTSDQPVALSVSRTNVGSDGSLTATGAYAFPLASQ